MEYKEHILSGCEENLHEWLMKHTWITWYIRDGDGNLRLVWDGTSPSGTSCDDFESTWQGYTRPADREDSRYDKYGRFIPEHDRMLERSKFTRILPECPYGVTIVEPKDEPHLQAYLHNSPGKDMPYLQFYTWSAFFRVREDPRFNNFGENYCRYNIEDYKDDWCGTILLDKFWVKETQEHDKDSPLQFIAISDAKHFGIEEYNDWANYIPKERHHSAWDLYYVLLIEQIADISHRVGLGKVFKEAFDNSCRREGKQWKEFILG